jgi:hypothetical protein
MPMLIECVLVSIRNVQVLSSCPGSRKPVPLLPELAQGIPERYQLGMKLSVMLDSRCSRC